MSQDGSRSMAQRKSATQSRVSGSTYSVNTTLRKTRAGLKEEMIAKKITEIFKEKEQRMIRTIEQTITEDKLRIYHAKKKEFEEELTELEADRKRIMKRKKNKKERMKLLKANTRQQFLYIAKALNATVLYYKQLYYENDYYRFKKLLDVQSTPEGEPPMEEKARQKAQLDQLNQFFMSPFKDDRRFTIYHLAQITRDRLESSNKLVNHLFFDKIFKMLITTNDEKNKLKAFEILCNLIQSQTHRRRLAKEGYFRNVYEHMQIGKVDDKTLEKLSWMTTLICFHPDMIEQIVSLRLLNFIIKLVDNKFPAPVRSNAVLAISLLTYHESLFNELISNGVIDIVMNLCMDQAGDLQVKQFSTLALVHFALSKQSINILIDKGIMDLFNSLGVIGDAQIQTNVSWIFLALCNNGITGQQMLTNGITRDMFLVSCNPQFNQIRHLVIAGFAELGRCTDMREHQERQQNGSLQRIKEKAIVGMHDAFKLHAKSTIDILLKFSISDEQKFMVTAFWALKDYILLNHDHLIADLSGVICAFVNGSAEDSDSVKTECANAISFLITHQLVFNKQDAEQKSKTKDPKASVWEFNPQQNYVLDALMLLSGSESLQVRTRAFSTLSTLSTYASQSEELMPQIQADIQMPDGMISRQYYKFITERIGQSREAFVKRYKQDDIETKYAGLYCLLRLAQSPDEVIAVETAIYLHQFYYPEHYTEIKIEHQLQQLQSTINEDLTFAQKERLSINLTKDECDTRDITLDGLNEKFFMFVFQALLYSKNRRILYLLLDVINFYIKHPTSYQDKVINAATILWMLQILDHSRQDRALCLLVAKTVLKIVDNHQILFDYQEMAIIKKFNKALENLNRDPNLPSEPSEDEEQQELNQEETIEQQSQRQQSESQKASQYESIAKEVREQLEIELKGKLDPQIIDDIERLSERARKSQPMDLEGADKLAIQTEKSSDMQSEQEQRQTVGISEQIEHHTSTKKPVTGERSHGSSIQHGSIAQQTLISNPKEQTMTQLEQESQKRSTPYEEHQSSQFVQEQNKSVSQISHPSQPQMVYDHKSQSVSQKLSSGHVSQANVSQHISRSRTSGLVGQQPQTNEEAASLKIMSSIGGHKKSEITSVQKDQSPMELSKKTSIKSTKSVQKREQEQSYGIRSGHSFLPQSNQQSEFDQQNNELRDALIKSFMVIFTNEKSQHLLLNQDIIDIAFSCLEYCDSISVDAKRNLARLISIIFKFPQVQERILQEKIVHGIVHLLGQDLQQTSIISHALRSCTYISLSYKFVNSPLSLQVLKALTPLMDRLDSKITKSQTALLQSQKITSPAEVMSDKDNCLFAIANLLKGSSVNARHFIQSDSPRKVMQEMISILDEADEYPQHRLPNARLEIIELCVASIKQLANTKQTFKEFLSFSKVNKQLLTICIQRVFQLSDPWFECNQELMRFKKILDSDQTKPVKKDSKLNSQAILDLNHENIENFKAIELLEGKEDRSIKMAPIVKIRNNIYYTIVGCFKSAFSIQFLLQDCNLLRRLVQDLQRDSLNDYIFQHLIMCLQSLMKDSEALEVLFNTYAKELFDLFTNTEQMDKKIVYIKSIIQAVLRIPEQICDSNPQFFGQLFSMAVDIKPGQQYKAELEDITENVLWLQTTLLELNLSESQNKKAISLCIQFQTAPILVKCLTNQNERIILQALKGLSTMSTLSEFKEILLLELGDQLFVSLADIINKRLPNFKSYKLEIETNIAVMLSQITQVTGNAMDALNVAARRRVVQQGFVDSFVNRCSELQYQVEAQGDEDDLDDLDGFDGGMDGLVGTKSTSHEFDLNMGQDGVDGLDFDDVDRITDGNQLMEYTFLLIANATELHENQFALIAHQSLMMSLLVSLAKKFLNHVASSGEDLPVSMLNFNYGNLKMGKYIAQIFSNLMSQHPNGVTEVQDICVKSGFGQLIVQLVQNITDYEMHIKLYQGLSEIVLSSNNRVATMAVEQGCYQELTKGAYESEFHKVRRICQSALEKVPQNLVDLNAKALKKRMF